MRKQLGIFTSLLFLSATAFLWMGCSSTSGWNSFGWNRSQPISTYDQPYYNSGNDYDNTQYDNTQYGNTQYDNIQHGNTNYDNTSNDSARYGQVINDRFSNYQSSPLEVTGPRPLNPNDYKEVIPESPSIHSDIIPQNDLHFVNQRPFLPGPEPYPLDSQPTPILGPDSVPPCSPFIRQPHEMEIQPHLINEGPAINEGPRFIGPPANPMERADSVSPDSFEQPPHCHSSFHCHFPPSNDLHCRDGVTVSARNPTMCILGEQYVLDFDVHACDDVCDVEVTTQLPAGVTYVRSQPEGKVDGNKLFWNFGPMRSGDCRPAKIWLRCDAEGEQVACFCATATPVRFCSLLCAKPILICEKCGPEEVCPGESVHYTITVTNKGTCTAEDVVVTDNVPDGLEHSSCLRTLTFKLGCLEPCQSKKVNICFTAVKRGKVCNTAVVTACNAESASCQWCTNVFKECVDITKVGPREQQIGKNADYQITVTNSGDKPLTDVIVTDNIPNATSVVAANGAAINGNQAVWRVREIPPGEKVMFTITLTTCAPGCFTNRVHVTDCQGCTACAEFTTRWRGRPALNVCISDTEDPICIGDTTSYNINVVNQGSEADDNVVVTVRFPREIEPLCAEGDSLGKVSGQTVTFEPYNNFAPHQTIRYHIDARGKVSGDGRVAVEVTSDSIRTPIVQQESTIVN